MLSVVIAASAIMVKTWYDYRFRFFLVLCFILIMTDLGTAFLAMGIALESTDFHKERSKALAIEIGITTVFFNGGSLLLHWLFSFKYWVISREIPKVLQGQILQSNEWKYNLYNAVGILVNMAICVWLGVRRGQLSA